MVFSFEPLCSTCVHFIQNKNGVNDLGLCKMFLDDFSLPNKKFMYNFAAHCRNNEHLCGKSGFLYEPNTELVSMKLDTNIVYDYDEISNRCCGEVNEKDELEQLEKDFFEIFQKIKKYNTARIYKYK
jgi:hypothetical protein